MSRTNLSLDATTFLSPSSQEHDKRQFRSDVSKVLSTLVPEWNDVSDSDIVLTHLSGAMTNVIFTCEKASDPVQKVLLRVYGHGTEAFFSRQEEIRVFKEISQQSDLGIGLLGEFQNGRLERMIEGRTCTAADIRRPDFSAKIAAKMAVFHTTQVDIDRKPRIVPSIHKLFKDAKAAYASNHRQFDQDAMARDIEALDVLLATVDSPVVFCHNDLQYGNIMVSAAKDASGGEEGEAVLIDFEYSHYNPRGYDVGNHFTEWCYNYHGDAPHVADFAKYPTVADQRRYCRAYLEASGGGEGVTDASVDALRHEANVYANATHLFWALWGFIQATQSTIDFDYFGYASCRWEAFQARVTLQDK